MGWLQYEVPLGKVSTSWEKAFDSACRCLLFFLQKKMQCSFVKCPGTLTEKTGLYTLNESFDKLIFDG